MCSVKVSRRVKCLIKSTEENEQEIVSDGDDEVVTRSERIVTDSPTLGIREPIYEVPITLISCLFGFITPSVSKYSILEFFCIFQSAKKIRKTILNTRSK